MKPSKSTPVTSIPSSQSSPGLRFLKYPRTYIRHSPTSYSNSLALSSTDSTSRTSFDEKAEIGGAHVTYETVKFLSSGPLVALSCEQGGAQVAVAGKDVLKVLSVDESSVNDLYNLRIGNSQSQNYNQGIHDVKWGNGYSASKIATSVNSGVIHIWDILKPGNSRYERKIDGNDRAVIHKISFQPNGGYCILSACHNGIMKIFDLRESTKAIHTFEGKADSVRDVQYNPVKDNEFVAAFENGSIQKWDIRSPKMYKKKLNAHDGQALTVDWHADGVIAASGGRDKTIKVWDLSSDLRRPLYTINTINSVARVAWRPGKPNEIASSSAIDSTVRIWDVRRPWIATLNMEEHNLGPIALAWVNTDVLYTVAKDKYFIRHDARAAQKPIQRLNKSAIGWNVYGDIAFATELRNGTVTEFVDESAYPGLIDFKTRRSGRRVADKHYSEEQPLYQPPKTSNIAHMPLFDFEWFAHAAQHYTISSENVWDACEQNARIAQSKQRYRTFQTWKILQLLFGQEVEVEEASNDVLRKEIEENDKGENEEISPMETRIMPLKDITEEREELSESSMEGWIDARLRHSLGSLRTNDYSPEEHEEFDEDSDDDIEDFPQSLPSITGKPMTPLMPSANYPRHSITPGLEGFGTNLEALQERKEEWHPTDILKGVLEYYTNQGDVQMCATLSLVLRKFVKNDEAQAGEWFTEYTNLLQRFRLWTIATEITNANKQISQADITVYVNCNHCYKPLVNQNIANVYWACERCRRLTNSCSICHQTVKGIYVWCQGCSHGGHLDHMRDWFKQMQKQPSGPVCPTGCGHACELTLGNAEESESLVT